MPSHERLAAAVHRFAGVAGCVSIIVGVAVLAGWILDVQSLKTVAPGLVSMKANTAIGFILAGGALWLLRDESAPRTSRTVGAGLGAVLAAFAALTLAEYIFAVDLRIDHLFSDRGVPGSHPGRPSPHTAAAFLTVGMWLATIARQSPAAYRVRDALSVIACVIVLQAAIGYLFGVRYLYGISGITGMAVHTMGTFAILCLGILAARPKQGFMGLLTSDGTGGDVARRLTPAVLVLPLLIGYLRLKAQEHGLIGTRDGLAILTGLIVLLIGAIVVYTGLSLNRADAERRVLEARLRELAERDPLTNLFNRRRFDEALKREVALAGRHGTCLALLMIDVDSLKQTNDTYGHRAGDKLIRGVATVLTNELRATDTAARLGGDEFAVLLPQIEPEGAETATAKLLAAVRSSSWQVHGKTIASTISAGIAVTNATPCTPSSLSDAADKALYRAKAAGGDRYSIAPPHTVSTAD